MKCLYINGVLESIRWKFQNEYGAAYRYTAIKVGVNNWNVLNNNSYKYVYENIDRVTLKAIIESTTEKQVKIIWQRSYGKRRKNVRSDNK